MDEDKILGEEFRELFILCIKALDNVYIEKWVEEEQRKSKSKGK